MLESLELGGDGDEIDAITNVEREFGVTLDYSHAPGWFTVGDVFQSLIKAIDKRGTDQDAIWQRFARAISDETGVDPTQVAPETKLIGGTPILEAIGKALKRLFNRDQPS